MDPTMYELHAAKMRARARGETTRLDRTRATLREGLKAMWMIGYDGPRSTPLSTWVLLENYACIFGLKRENGFDWDLRRRTGTPVS